MDSMVLACAFAAALAISACVVLLFSSSIDEVLSRVIPHEMISAWSLYLKFGLFTATFAGGLRPADVADMVLGRPAGGQPPLSAGQGVLTVVKTILGALIAASGTLLVIFGAALAVYVALRAYLSYGKAPVRAGAAHSRPAEPQPVGAERHAAGKERQRAEEAGRFL